MPRSACTRHPKDKVIEIPIGAKYCERCNHLVLPEPEMEIVAIVQEMELEAETEQSVEEMKEEVEKIIEDSNIPEEVKKDIVIEIVKETPVEAEPEQVTDPPVTKAEVDKAVIEAQEAKKAEIASIRARLAELEKTEE